jgi:hypothetical protein
MWKSGGAVLALVLAAAAAADDPAPRIDAVLAHPVFSLIYACSEHAYGTLHGLGDELGTDCYVEDLVERNGRSWMRPYRTDGLKNEDWFGWGADVLAPCTGQVENIRENKITNEPGFMGKPPASSIRIDCGADLHFLVGHIAAPRVKAGDHVAAGQVIAQVGNNGMSRHPHIHVAAWRGKTALQIRWDQVHIAN